MLRCNVCVQINQHNRLCRIATFFTEDTFATAASRRLKPPSATRMTTVQKKNCVRHRCNLATFKYRQDTRANRLPPGIADAAKPCVTIRAAMRSILHHTARKTEVTPRSNLWMCCARKGPHTRGPLSTQCYRPDCRTLQAYLRSSSLAICARCTSSGPSASRSVLLCAYMAATGKSWQTPPPPCA